MFETFIKNIKHFGHSVFIYSWVIGVLGALGFIIITHEIGISLIVGIVMWIKWAIIGFLMELFADMFLKDLTKDKN